MSSSPSESLLAATEETRALLECPVCVQIYRNPKSLPCGHSVCTECCRKLNKDRFHTMCPVCRRTTTIPVDNLPINFGLRDLVQHHVDSVKQKKFSCTRCGQRVKDDVCWMCNDCHAVVCSNCGISHHQTHKLEQMSTLVAAKERVLTEWRSMVDELKDEISRSVHSVSFNSMKILKGLQTLKMVVGNKVVPCLDAETKNFDREFRELQIRYCNVSAASLVASESGRTENDFATLPREFESLKEKQSEIIKHQEEVFEAMKKCNDTLMAVFPNVETPPRASFPSITTAPATAQTPPATSSLRLRIANGEASVVNTPDEQSRRRVVEESPSEDDDDEVVVDSSRNVVPPPRHVAIGANNPRARFGSSAFPHSSTLVISNVQPGNNENAFFSTDDEEHSHNSRGTLLNRAVESLLESGRRRPTAVRTNARVPSLQSARRPPRLQLRVADTNPTSRSTDGTLRYPEQIVDVEDDDSLEEMDTAGPSTANRNGPRSANTDGNRPGSLKRFRQAANRDESSENETSDTSDAEQQNAVDSTIEFRILHKMPGQR